jgi:hypothetical protein
LAERYKVHIDLHRSKRSREYEPCWMTNMCLLFFMPLCPLRQRSCGGMISHPRGPTKCLKELFRKSSSERTRSPNLWHAINNFMYELYNLCSINIYEGVSKSFRAESIIKHTLTTINTHWEATQRVVAAKLNRLTHKIAIQLHLVAESCTICSSRSRRPVRKLLNTLSYTDTLIINLYMFCIREWGMPY